MLVAVGASLALAEKWRLVAVEALLVAVEGSLLEASLALGEQQALVGLPCPLAGALQAAVVVESQVSVVALQEPVGELQALAGGSLVPPRLQCLWVVVSQVRLDEPQMPVGESQWLMAALLPSAKAPRAAELQVPPRELRMAAKVLQLPVGVMTPPREACRFAPPSPTDNTSPPWIYPEVRPAACGPAV